MENKLTTWYHTYRHIAELLSAFYKKNESSSARNMLNVLLDSEYGNENEWLRNSKTKHKATGVDPIQLMASFNNSNSKPETRILRIRLLLNALGSKKQIELTKDFFLGCPTPIIAQVINSRKDLHQNQIWQIFNSVFENGKRGLTQNHFDAIYNWYGINLGSFTIFIFWIDTENFLPLDSNTVTYLVGLEVIEGVPSNYDDYMKLCNLNHKQGIYREIVRAAYEVIGKKKKEVLITKEVNDFLNLHAKGKRKKTIKKREEKIELLLHNFSLIAIKPTKKKQEHIKNLELKPYKFYDSYDFIDGSDKKIKYTYGIESEIYSINDKAVSISAVVGKNGSGKSTITELLFLAINQLSLDKKLNDRLHDEKVYVDVYFFTNELYKLSFGDKIVLKKYSYDGVTKIYSISHKNVIDKFDLTHFFYTVAINYSLYGLNSKIIGRWINPLFHKNDSYQMPVVLNPKRDEGTINVNTEEELAKSRLLAFVLDWDRLVFDDDSIKTPELVEQKTPLSLKIVLDIKKLENNRKRYEEFLATEKWEVIVNDFFELIEWFDIKAKKYVDEVKEYIYYKLISISETYDIYGDYVDIDPDEKVIHFKDLLGYAESLLEDTSHITFKLRQSLNYLKYNHININPKGNPENIIELAGKINDIQKDEFENNNLKLETIELIPPSIFKSSIIFKDNSPFEALSSGEKQSIFAINTVAYHIYNINSVSTTKSLTKYNYVNIIFDEVELYFHPDMQRTFIFNLLRYLQQIQLPNILGFNFMFVTHSPFILSDIPSQNILRMEDGNTVDDKKDGQTFGANIHDLLANDFFLEKGFIGEFAKERINDLIIYLRFDPKKEMNNENLSPILNWTKESAKKLISIIGEPILKMKLAEMYDSKFSNDFEVELLKQRIKELEKGKE